jgi:hypothetical protein
VRYVRSDPPEVWPGVCEVGALKSSARGYVRYVRYVSPPVFQEFGWGVCEVCEVCEPQVFQEFGQGVCEVCEVCEPHVFQEFGQGGM